MKQNPLAIRFSFRLTLAMTLALATSGAQAADAPSFEGKTISLVVGYDPGGTADADARFIARHIGRFLPGNPSVIVRNSPGAGGISALNLAASAPRPDGLTFHQLSGAHFLQQLVGSKAVRFDLGRMPVIGGWLRSTYVLSVRADGPYTSIAAIRAAKTSPRIGTQGLGSATYAFSVGWGAALGLDLQLLRGYEGNTQTLALERGEVDARTTTVSAMLEHGDEWQRNFPAVVQSGPGRDPDMPGVPAVDELTADPGALWRLINEALSVDRPYALAPGAPPIVAATYREAWSRMLSDPEFVADAAQMHWRVAPTRFDAIERLFRKTASDYPEEMLTRLREMFP